MLKLHYILSQLSQSTACGKPRNVGWQMTTDYDKFFGSDNRCKLCARSYEVADRKTYQPRIENIELGYRPGLRAIATNLEKVAEGYYPLDVTISRFEPRSRHHESGHYPTDSMSFEDEAALRSFVRGVMYSHSLVT